MLVLQGSVLSSKPPSLAHPEPQPHHRLGHATSPKARAGPWNLKESEKQKVTKQCVEIGETQGGWGPSPGTRKGC